MIWFTNPYARYENAMSEELNTNGVRLRAALTFDVQPSELVVFGLYTGRRAQADYGALASAFETHLNELSTSGTAKVIAQMQTMTVFVDEWQTPALAADSWGTAASFSGTPGAPATNETLPPQVAIAVSSETDEQTWSRGRRRNRHYLGMIPSSNCAQDGTIETASIGVILDAYEAFDVALRTIPVAAGVPTDLAGLCNVSYAGQNANPLGSAQIAPTDRLRVGRVFDTQRSRRNALLESYTVRTAPFGP